MKSYFNLVWAALLNRPIMNRAATDGSVAVSGNGAVIRNCRFEGALEVGVML